MSVLLIDADGELWYTRQEELGVDCITTDNPDVLGNVIKDAGR